MSQRRHIMLAEARFYPDIADNLVAGAAAVLEAAGASWERVTVPGAFELPGALACAARGTRPSGYEPFDGYVALGCVIRGETSHYEHVCTECARGLQQLAVSHNLALGFGVLTCETRSQAEARADPAGRDAGGGAAASCLRMLEIKRHFAI